MIGNPGSESNQKGIVGLSEEIVGCTLKMFAEIIMRVRLILTSCDYGMPTTGGGAGAPGDGVAILWGYMERATQGYMKVLRDYAAARHALALAQTPLGKPPRSKATRTPNEPFPPAAEPA